MALVKCPFCKGTLRKLTEMGDYSCDHHDAEDYPTAFHRSSGGTSTDFKVTSRVRVQEPRVINEGTEDVRAPRKRVLGKL